MFVPTGIFILLYANNFCPCISSNVNDALPKSLTAFVLGSKSVLNLPINDIRSPELSPKVTLPVNVLEPVNVCVAPNIANVLDTSGNIQVLAAVSVLVVIKEVPDAKANENRSFFVGVISSCIINNSSLKSGPIFDRFLKALPENTLISVPSLAITPLIDGGVAFTFNESCLVLTSPIP